MKPFKNGKFMIFFNNVFEIISCYVWGMLFPGENQNCYRFKISEPYVHWFEESHVKELDPIRQKSPGMILGFFVSDKKK